MSLENQYKVIDSRDIGKEKSFHKYDISSLQSQISGYSIKVENIRRQIQEINESHRENTGVIGGMGDWIGEKIRAYETGKEIYENQMKQTHERAKVLYEQIFAEFNGKTLSPSEQANIEALMQKLEQAIGTKLTEISWGKAVFNSAHIDEIHGDSGNLENRAKIFTKTTIGLAEGGYEGVAFLAELGKITIEATAIVAAFIASSLSESSILKGEFHSSVGEQISSDVSEIFSKLTLENAQKALALLPKVLESFSNASSDVQAEGFGKFFGMMLVPLGIGIKGVRFGKTLVNTGVATIKDGVETASRAAQIAAKQAKRAIGPSKKALQVAGKASAAGTMTVGLGAGTAAAGAATIIEGTVVRYAGEMGGGGEKRNITEAIAVQGDNKLKNEIPREPLKLEAIKESEFQNLSIHQIERMEPELKKVIGGMKYNSIGRTIDLIDLFEKRKVQNPDFTLQDAFKEFKIQKTPEEFLREGGNCSAMAIELQRTLSSSGIQSNVVRFRAGGLVSEAANAHVGSGHSGVIIPRVEHGEKLYTFLDPGLLIPKPITFALGKSSPEIALGGDRSVQIVYNPSLQEFPYELVMRSKDVVKSKMPFDPNHTILNPHDTISKDIMRGLADFKMVKQSNEGQVLGLARVDIARESITIQAGKDREFISFKELPERLQEPKIQGLLQVTSEILGEDKQDLLNKIRKIIQYSSDYKQQIWISNPA